MKSPPGKRPTGMLLKIHDLKPSNTQEYQNKTSDRPYGGAKAIIINHYHNQLNCPESFGNQWLDDKDGVDKKTLPEKFLVSWSQESVSSTM